MKYVEYNCDGLIGPNHNYCGLAFGNVASLANKNAVSNPKQAALQGLDKMKRVMELGGHQLVLPPQMRPCFDTLRQLGFTGTTGQILQQVSEQDMQLLANTSSASAMWAANSATVTPSVDSLDGKVHFTSANLNDKFHRSVEAEPSRKILEAIFNQSDYFCHHPVLPQSAMFGDEGAANHARLCVDHSDKGLHVYVYGRDALDLTQPAPVKFPARHTLQASQALARAHQVPTENQLFLQQNPDIIDRGIFHNDVIAMGNRNVYIYHQDAYLNSELLKQTVASHFAGQDFYLVEVTNQQVTIDDALATYLFNSQIVDIGADQMVLIVPKECEANQNVAQFLAQLPTMNTPIREVIYQDLTQSMRNGGGPACLRLRVVLNEQQAKAINQRVILTDTLYEQLRAWIEQHYRDELSPNDLASIEFVNEVQTAFKALEEILGLEGLW